MKPSDRNQAPPEPVDRERERREGNAMKKLGFTTIVASGLVAAALGLAGPAAAAPTGPGNAEQTISELEAKGYNVIVNRIGTTPLDQATVVAVRPGQTYTQADRSGPGDDLTTRVVNKTVYVDVR